MKRFNHILLGAALVSTISFGANATCDYGTYSGNDLSSRTLKTFTLADDADSSATFDVNQPTTSSNKQIYFDLTESEPLLTTPGSTVKFTNLEWIGGWMHGYLFVDYNGDEDYNSTLNRDGETKEESDYGELVSYSFYANPESDYGKNSAGETVRNNEALGNGNGSAGAAKMPSFVIPSDLKPGLYRVLFKIDWNDITPCGDQVARSSGAAVEFYIKIDGEEFSGPNVSLTYVKNTSPNGVNEDRVDIDNPILFSEKSETERHSVSMGAWIRMTSFVSSGGNEVGNAILQYGGLNHNNANGLIVVKTNGSGNICVGGFGLSNAPHLGISSGIVTSQTVALNEWHYVAVAVDFEKEEVRVYYDGQNINTTAMAGQKKFDSSIWNGDNPWGFGFGGMTFNGSMDDIHIIDGAITDEEAEYLYNDQPLKVKGLAGWYTFDEVKEGTVNHFANQVAAKSEYDAIYYKITGTPNGADGGLINVTRSESVPDLETITEETQRVRSTGPGSSVPDYSISIEEAGVETEDYSATIFAKNVKAGRSINKVVVEYSLNDGEYIEMQYNSTGKYYYANLDYEELEPGLYEVTVKASGYADDELKAEDEKEAGSFTAARRPDTTINFDMTSLTVESNGATVKASVSYGHTIEEMVVEYTINYGVDFTEMEFKEEDGCFIGFISFDNLTIGKEYEVELKATGYVNNESVNSRDTYVDSFKVPAEAGIEEISAEIANGVRYINLQGVEVSNPVPGIYIRVEGNQTSKVYIK